MSAWKDAPMFRAPRSDLAEKLQTTSINDRDEDSSSKTKSYLLIVNGQKMVTDDLPMGDWFGLCSVFRENNFGGDFWTAVDPDDYLRATYRDDVKFGRKKKRSTETPDKDIVESQVLYKSGENATNPRFVVIAQDQIKSRVLRWISDKAKIANFGDAVTIVLIGHGSDASGGFRLGKNLLLPDEYAQAIKAFKSDVQVNTVYNGCYSAWFYDAILETHEKRERRFIHVAAGVDEPSAADPKSPSGRYRQSAFTRVWVKHMKGISERGRDVYKSPPEEQSSQGSPKKGLTIERHRDKVLAATSQRKTPDERSHAQLFFSPNHLHWTNMLSKVLFRKYVEIDVDPKLKSLRMRIESHTTRAMVKAASRTPRPSKDTVDHAMFLCDRENQAFDDEPMPSEMGLWSASSNKERRHRNLPNLLLNLYWRARKQMAIFEVYCMLFEHGLASEKALAVPVRYSRTPQNVRNVMQMLGCFDKMKDLEMPPELNQPNCELNDFDMAAHWFAAMICRSCHDLEEVNNAISLIQHSKRLGSLDVAKVQSINEKHAQAVEKAVTSPSKGKGKGKEKEVDIAPLYSWDPMENAAEKVSHRIWGLMLPSGNGSDIHVLFDEANTKFLEIEKVFKAFFGVGDDELALEDLD
ncbi:MAG: hypothetical protein Q9166_002524 [cf. Caloplaca sp. 2 TL-2023]